MNKFIDIIASLIEMFFGKAKGVMAAVKKNKKILPVRDTKQIYLLDPNMKRYGCNVTSQANIFSYYLKKLGKPEIEPVDLYNKGLQSGACDKQAFIQNSDKMARHAGLTRNLQGSSPSQELVKTKLDQGDPMVVSMKTSSGYHFSSIIGWQKEGENYIFRVNDPMNREMWVDGQTGKFFNFVDGQKKYTVRKWLKVYWFYEVSA